MKQKVAFCVLPSSRCSNVRRGCIQSRCDHIKTISPLKSRRFTDTNLNLGPQHPTPPTSSSLNLFLIRKNLKLLWLFPRTKLHTPRPHNSILRSPRLWTLRHKPNCHSLAHILLSPSSPLLSPPKTQEVQNKPCINVKFPLPPPTSVKFALTVSSAHAINPL
ncbi:uncharacterized protein LY89DRAFT_682856 [Mollisia scopiformis]|uniref:Uncharacterized protein n=1 Tax=Mollisia scopiformis TaxID=149040 RepID=A0A194XIR5_MOLSC|nr:uncharacterized protein LY89DRAFT_682856 [Mollisia scopiformis]KUJ20053.1 hypothetical protein LY89DRAFT_682856 [Mollisia scopiformis]